MAPSGTFSGFTGSTLYTPVPNPVFGPILEQIQDMAELKVTLRGLWLFHRKRTPLRAVTLDEFLVDRSLIRGLKSEGHDAAQEIRRGLRLAVSRGTFLTHQVDGARTVFLLNTEAGRRAIAGLDAGDADAPLAGIPHEQGDEPVGDVPDRDRPNIFALYEDSIGSLSPLLAEELKEAEARYPETWLREAFGIAVAENKRSWRYVAGILRRWTAEGKEKRGDAGRGDAGRGEAGRGEDGKPGRHTEKDQRQKYLEDYQRRWGNTPRQRAGR